MITQQIKNSLTNKEKTKKMKIRPKPVKIEQFENKIKLTTKELKTIERILKSKLGLNIEFALTIIKKIRK